MSTTLAATGLTKVYPGVKALSDAHLTLRPGSIHALLGENGAGKSTLVKILTGVHAPNSGTLLLEGTAVAFSNPLEATKAGIGVVHQERNVVSLFSVEENITLQDPPKRFGFIDRQSRTATARKVLATLEFEIDPSTPVSELSVAQVQLVEIGKALARDTKVLILDEPTASLTDSETSRLFTVLRRLRDSGVAIVFVSHKLEEVFDLCDTVTVLRDGVTVVDSQPLSAYTQRGIVSLMVGRTLDEMPVRLREIDRSGTSRFSVHQVDTALGHRDISLQVHSGEILGLYGLVGAGRSELARAILGLAKITAGEVKIDGKAVRINSVKDAVHRYRLGYVTEDRKSEGVFLEKDVRFNIGATVWRTLSGRLGVSSSREEQMAKDYIDALSIRVSSARQLVGQLSGGNQQKVSLSKWLAANCRILIIDEPTVGVDVRTKEDFQRIIMDLADKGLTIVLIDSDMAEMITLADRIAVLNDYQLIDVIENTKDYAEISTKLIELIHQASADMSLTGTASAGQPFS